uniref:Uncharacterized protein n=1 Tax=Buteo japonicus TaxID=224669 RepID=A0A8C0B5N0_9AVES
MLLLLRSSWHSGKLLLPLVVQRGASADDIKKAYMEETQRRNSEKSPRQAGLSGKLKTSGRGKAYNTHKDINHLNSEYIIAHFYPDMFRESIFYSVKALVVTNISRMHRKHCGRRRERNRCFLPILGVSPVPGTGFTSFGSSQARGCSSSIALLNSSSRKGNFRSVIAMNKIITGLKIPTERIVTNGKERIETDFKEILLSADPGLCCVCPYILYL